MIKTFTATLLLLLSFTIKAQNINIPDANFKKALVDNTRINTDGDGEISESEAAAFTGRIDVFGEEISDLTGIEYFINITELDCRSNLLNSLNLSKNTAITDLNCFNNQLTNIVFSDNNQLKKLDCSFNQLLSLDLSNCTKLLSIDCRGYHLTSLDLSMNTAITNLKCNHNKLTNLDLSKNTQLTDLECRNNGLTRLDLSINTAITNIDCSNNQLTSLDISKYKAITDLTCSYNQLSSLDVSNNAQLTTLYCISNQLTSLNLNNNTQLTKLYCGSNQLTSLNLNNNTQLTNIYCGSNQLTNINLSQNTQLNDLNCCANQLTSLDLSKNTTIEKIYCPWNNLSNLDLSKNTTIEKIYCPWNNLSNLDLSNNPKMLDLDCSNNQLTSLDVSKNTAITDLDFCNNQLSNVDLSKNTELTNLNCYNNQLSSLDISKNTKLHDLNCTNNTMLFSELQKIKKICPEFIYSYSKSLFTPIDKPTNYQVDYSSEVLIDGNETTFKWFKNDTEITDEEINEESSGEFKFLKEGAYYCEMTNASFPDLTLQTNTITIYSNDIVSIPDTNFKKALLENSSLNLNGDSEISEYEAGIYRDKLDISGKDIADLTGIEHFINITHLDCKANKIENLWLGYNKKLVDVNCSHNQLTNLDIRSNSSLKSLNCSYNELTYLLVSDDNSQLVKLNIDQNHLPLSNLNKVKAVNPKLIEIEKSSADYLSRQFGVFDEVDEEVNYEIDYSLEASFDGNETSFKWTIDYGMNQADETSVTMIKSGVFKFLKAGYYHCEMTNATFPDIVVATSVIKINKKEQSITFNSLPSRVRMYDVLELEATASSGLKVNLELVSGDASLVGNKLTFNKEGTVVIKATQAGNDEFEAIEKTIEFQVDFVTGITEVLKSSIQVYPNPVESYLNIRFEKNEKCTIRIYNILGNLKLQKECFSNKETLNLSDFKSGMYLMRIQFENESVTYKIIKK